MKKQLMFTVALLALIACDKSAKEAEVAVSSVSLNQNSIEMIIGETSQLRATISPSNATVKTVSWASSKQSVATVSESGLVSAIAEGTATITASAGGKSATCEINVVSNLALSGLFSVSSTQKVKFSKGNLRYTSGAWSFFDNQWDYYTSYSSDAWDKFGWSTSKSSYGMTTSYNTDDYYGDFVDWGSTIGSGWRTLSLAEWTYLLKSRSITNRYCKATVNNVPGMVIFPDSYTHPTGITAIADVNNDDTAFTTNTWSGDAWSAMETVGAVFLPASGRRSSTSVYDVESYGYYWSSTLSITDPASYALEFLKSNVHINYVDHWYKGFSVRLVKDQ